MYTLLNNLGVFGNDYYWSSSENDSDPWFAWEQDFSNGDQKKAQSWQRLQSTACASLFIINPSIYQFLMPAMRRHRFYLCIMHGFLHILSQDIISFHDRLISALPVRKSIMFICVMPLFEVSFLSRLKTYLGEWFVRFLNAPYSRSKVF